MKEFEKWWRSGPSELKGFCMPTDSLTKIGWRAALSWVLSIDSGFCNCGCPNDSVEDEAVLAKIRKELEE